MLEALVELGIVIVMFGIPIGLVISIIYWDREFKKTLRFE